jgi:glutathione-regulated potassium-efflux system protein KefB
MLSDYFADLIILLTAAVIAVPIAQTFRLGVVPGFLIAGVAVGPYGLGLIDKVSEISHFSEIGVVLLLFVIGIELKPAQLWRMRRLVFGLGSLQIIISGFALGAVAYSLFDIRLKAAVLIGPALALSSTAFVLQIIAEQKRLLSKYGRSSIGILLMQDVAVVPLLALVPLITMTKLSITVDIGFALLESVLILALVVAGGRYLLHPLLYRVAKSGNDDIFTASAVLIVLGIAFITERAGLSMAMGAFLAGLLISDSHYRHQIYAEIQPFRGLLLGLFFMSMGMSFNLTLLIQDPIYFGMLVAGLIIIKVVILFPIAYFFNIGKRNSVAVSLVLAQSGEFALVLFSLAFQAQILSEILFQQLLLIVLTSMLVTPLLGYWANRLLKSKSSDQPAEEPKLDAPVVIAGFGRVGHRIGSILTRMEKAYVALDVDANLVADNRAKGFPVYFGDVIKPEVLKAAGAHNAEVIIVTVNDPKTTDYVVSNLVKKYPGKHIYARAHDLEQCRRLRSLGATVVSENFEASLELARVVLKNLSVDKDKSKSVLQSFRSSYQQQIDEVLQDKQ